MNMQLHFFSIEWISLLFVYIFVVIKFKLYE